MSCHPPARLRRAALVVLLASCVPAWAATTPGEPKDVALRRTVTGTVTAVDPATRRLTLKGARGPATYRIDPKVTDMEQLKVGERVRVDVVAALVLTLRRGGKEMQEQVEKEVLARSGEPVAGGTTVVTKVLAVDRKAQTVRLKGPAGRVEDFRIQDGADLVGVRVGDQVVAVLHEAVVVGWEPSSR